MFGLEILDVVIGLTFVYLLLALFATALNEYIAAVLNLRGKELAKGLGQLLDDIDEGDALQQAWDGVGKKITTSTASLTEQLYNHRLIRPFATRQGWMTRVWRRARNHRFSPIRWWRGVYAENPRLPSYIPARTFALALLDVLGIDEKDASLERLIPEGIAQTPDEARKAVEDAEAALREAETAATSATDAGKKAVADARLNLSNARLAQAVADAKATLATAVSTGGANNSQASKAVAEARGNVIKAQLAQATALAEQRLTTAQGEDAVANAQLNLAKVKLAKVLAILKQESPLELTEHLETLTGLPQADKLASALQVQVAGIVAGSQSQLQKLHDGVEVWFNNAMDRVSGAYKRTAQGWLFVLGLLVASCMNADTIDMWRRLESDDELRSAMVRRAEAAVAPMDSAVADSAATARTSTVPASSPSTATTASAPPADTNATRVPAADSVARLAQVADSPAVTLTSATGSATPGTRATTSSDSAKYAAVKRARANYQTTKTRLDSMELKLGWTTEQGVEARLLRKDSIGVYPRANASPPRRFLTYLEDHWAPAGYHADLFPFDTGPSWVKLIGLLLTALAISLGAPFWFDLLNKVISIRAAGRSPEERPKSPEGGPKRIAERAPK